MEKTQLLSNDELEFAMLRTIEGGFSIHTILKYQLPHSVIIKCISELNGNGLITYSNNQLILSKSGIQRINALSNKLKFRGLYRYVIAEYEQRGPKIEIDDIYIPITGLVNDDVF